MSAPSISAVIMARNEAENIEQAISTLRFASQIVVADTGSRDNTMELAEKCGAEVHSIEFDGYGNSKNRAISFCRNEWIFCMDADERVSPELAQGILNSCRNDSGFNGFAVNRMSYFLGKPVRHSGWYPDYVLRLFKNGKGKFCEKLVHESVELEGKQGKLSGLLYHYSYRDLESYFEKLNVYTSLNAEQMFKSGREPHLGDFLFHPPATFLKMYLVRGGFLDGFNGLLLASLSAFQVYMKYAKLRQLYKGETQK